MNCYGKTPERRRNTKRHTAYMTLVYVCQDLFGARVIEGRLKNEARLIRCARCKAGQHITLFEADSGTRLSRNRAEVTDVLTLLLLPHD